MVLATVFSELASAAPLGTDLADPVFGGAATFAALFLPAAGLAEQFAGTSTEDLAEELVRRGRELGDTDPEKRDQARRRLEAVETVIERSIRSVATLPCTFVMFVAAFLLASVALLGPDPVIVESSWRPLQVPLPAVLIGTAVALDFVAVCKLLPFAWALVDQRSRRTLQQAARDLRERSLADDEPPPAPLAQAEAGSPAGRPDEG